MVGIILIPVKIERLFILKLKALKDFLLISSFLSFLVPPHPLINEHPRRPRTIQMKSQET